MGLGLRVWGLGFRGFVGKIVHAKSMRMETKFRYIARAPEPMLLLRQV